MSREVSLSATVIIPTKGRFTSLCRVLQGLSRQSADPSAFNVIVVIDGRGDMSYEKLSETDYPFLLQIIWQDTCGAGSARNRGASAATSDILLFLDDDVQPTKDWISRHLEAHKLHDPHVLFIGPLWSPPDYSFQPWVAWEQDQLAEKYRRMISGELAPNPHQFYTGNVSLRRHEFSAVGGFDPEIQRAEDLELAYRLAENGLSFKFLPSAGGFHYAQRSYESWLDIAYQYGWNSVYFAQQKGHPTLLDTILAGYRSHHPFIRILVDICLDRKLITRMFTRSLTQVALASYSHGWTPVAFMALSAVFNLRRYQGLSDALGGRMQFFSVLRTG